MLIIILAIAMMMAVPLGCVWIAEATRNPAWYIGTITSLKANGKLYACSAEDIDGTWKIVDEKTCAEKAAPKEPAGITAEDLNN